MFSSIKQGCSLLRISCLLCPVSCVFSPCIFMMGFLPVTFTLMWEYLGSSFFSDGCCAYFSTAGLSISISFTNLFGWVQSSLYIDAWISSHNISFLHSKYVFPTVCNWFHHERVCGHFNARVKVFLPYVWIHNASHCVPLKLFLWFLQFQLLNLRKHKYPIVWPFLKVSFILLPQTHLFPTCHAVLRSVSMQQGRKE